MIDQEHNDKLYGGTAESADDDVQSSSNQRFPFASFDNKSNSLFLIVDKFKDLGKKILEKFQAMTHLDTPKTQENDALSELSTLDNKVSELRKKTLRRIYTVIGIFSIGMFIMLVLVKFGIVMWKESKRPEVPTKVQGLTLEVNSLNKWQEMKDQQIKELGDDLKSVEANVTTKMDELQKTISTELNSTQANVNESLIVLQSSNKQVINEALTDIKNEIRNMGEETKQYTDQRNLTISEKIAQIESKKGESAKLAVLPPLPPLQNSGNATQTIPNGIPSQPSQKVPQVPQYMEEDINDASNASALDFSTIATKDTNSSDDGIKMTVMAGVQKATLVAGADVPTLQKGNDLTRVVWLSTSGPMLISNGHTENIRECIIQAAATGNFATGSADIRLSKISCSAIDEEGKYYKLVGSIKGWVYGENGKQGLKGRLVTKEGELIEKAIPLAILEGAIKALENSTKKGSTIYAYPGSGTSSTSTMNNLQDSFSEGATKTASTTLDKFSDYYLMILEQLNPTIELKAGREVSIWFEGGEQLKFEEFTPADVDFFEHKGLEQ